MVDWPHTKQFFKKVIYTIGLPSKKFTFEVINKKKTYLIKWTHIFGKQWLKVAEFELLKYTVLFQPIGEYNIGLFQKLEAPPKEDKHILS